MSEEFDKDASSDSSNFNGTDTGGIEKITASKEWGYDLYPERKSRYKSSFKDKLLLGGTENIDRANCERTVYECFKTHKLVKLMRGALKASGCPVDLRRHISCEICDSSVMGGYDPVLNQIVVCQNLGLSKGVIQSVLIHEMIHMFDFCRHKLDFTNLEHVACTEIRAANLTYCSFVSAWIQGDASPFNFKKRHEECVKNKAVASLLSVRNVTDEQAVIAVEKVFPKCYNDLEPIGRRIKRIYEDVDKAYEEGVYYGYV